MKKTFLSVISLLISISLVIPSIFTVDLSAAEAQSEMGTIEEILASYYDPDGRPMSCAHRAITAIGNPIPENSLAAIQDCIDHKVDIVELDIMRTKDGVFVLCHDDTINRTTTYEGESKISEMTYAEICEYPLRQYTGGSNKDVYLDENGKSLTIPTFEDALKLCKGKVMINLDKFKGQWDYRMELYELVKANECLDIVMFKGSNSKFNSEKLLSWHDEIKAEYGDDAVMPNFCTINSNRDAEEWISEIKAHYDAKTAFAVEAGFSEYTQPQSNPEYIAEAKQYIRVFANVLYDALGGTYSAKNRENSTGWAEIISLGFNILQTNNSADLAAYIYANYSAPTKNIADGIDLLYFNDFKHEQTVHTLKINAPSVKLYDGDYIGFKNVDFGTSAGKNLIVNITENAGKGELVIRKDSHDGDVIASFDLTDLGSRPITAVEEIKISDLGVCDVYICAENLDDGYVSASKLSAKELSYGEIDRVVGLYFFTRPGVAPALPSQVSAIDSNGFSYKVDVEWADIPEECYAEDLTYFEVPGIIRSDCMTVYAKVTVIDLDMTDAAVWFDSNGEMKLSDSGEVLEWYDSVNQIAAVVSDQAPAYKDGAVSFDGNDDSLTYNHSLSNKGNISIIINAKTDKKSTEYMDEYKINNSARYTLLHYPEEDSWGSVYFTAFKNGIVCRFGSGKSGNRGIYYTGDTVDGWATVAATKNRRTEKIYLGSEMVFDRSASASSDYQAGSAGNLIVATEEYAYIGLGIQGSVNHYYNGDVRDIVIFERTLEDSEIATLDAYFKAKNENTLNNKSDLAKSAFDTLVESGEIEIHSFKYADKDEMNHTKTCEICSYECDEAHEYDEAAGKCSVCGREKPAESQNSGIVIIISAAAAVVVIAAAVAVVVMKKKKSNG